MVATPHPELVPRQEPAPGQHFREVPVLTKEEVKALNFNLALQRAREGGLRAHIGFFRCPWPCTQSQYEQYKKKAVEKWIEVMAKQGWALKSKVAVNANRRRPAYGWSGDWVQGALLDQVEIPVAGFFQKDKVEALRLEIPVRAD